MNKNTFQSQRNHTRVKFEPLTVSCSLVCLTPQSPATQSINTTLTPIQYQPDRAASPTVIFPDVRANDIDNVFGHGSANEYLSVDSKSLKWQVDGKDIEKVWTVGTDYEIVKDASDTRGALRVKKNLAANEKAALRFFGEFLDWRTGIVYKVESDELALTCTDKGDNVMQCNVDKPLIEYDPLYDDLLLYDYKVANNIPVQGSRESFKNGKSFEQTVNVLLTSGTTELTSLPTDTTMRLVKVGSTTPIVANSEANPEVTEISFPNISFDMRLVSKEEYSVQFLQNSKVIASATIGLHTSTTMPTFGKPAYSADIAASQTEYFNSVMLNLSDRMVEYPELYYLIEWFTQAKYNDNGTWKYAAEKTWQRGVNMEAVADLGIGITHNDSFFDIWFDVNPHAVCELLADEDNIVLTDEDGVMLID